MSNIFLQLLDSFLPSTKSRYYLVEVKTNKVVKSKRFKNKLEAISYFSKYYKDNYSKYRVV